MFYAFIQSIIHTTYSDVAGKCFCIIKTLTSGSGIDRRRPSKRTTVVGRPRASSRDKPRQAEVGMVEATLLRGASELELDARLVGARA